MANFKPSGPFVVPMNLQIPTIKIVKGTEVKEYSAEKTHRINGTFRTFRGTEKTINNKVAVEDTGVVETWYRPDITSDCRIQIGGTNYEILGTPEDIQQRHQFCTFKVRATKGNA